MNHRPRSEIDADITAAAARMNVLQLERAEARQAEIDTVARLFDAGLSIREIARETKQGAPAVQGILFRSGRTEKGRTAIRHRIAAAMAPQVPA